MHGLCLQIPSVSCDPSVPDSIDYKSSIQLYNKNFNQYYLCTNISNKSPTSKHFEG